MPLSHKATPGPLGQAADAVAESAGSVDDGSGTAVKAGAGAAPARDDSIPRAAKRLLRLMAPYRFRLWLSVACAVLSAVLSLSPYVAVALVLADMASGRPDWSFVLLTGAGALAGVLAQHALYGLATGLSHAIAFDVQRSLRLELAAKLARVPLGFFDDTSKGRARTVLIDDVETIEDGMAHLIPDASGAVIAPILTLLAMALLDWRLALLSVLPFLLGMVLLRRVMERAKGSTRGYLEIQAQLAEAAGELADGLPTYRMFNQAGRTTQRLRSAISKLSRFSASWMRYVLGEGALAHILLSNHLVFVGPVGLVLAANGTVTLPTLALFLAVAYGLGDLFTSLQGISQRLTRQVHVLERIEALELTPEIAEPVRPQRPTDTTILFDDVSFSYGQRRVLDGIAFRAAPGECIALVGASGSGKSTLARLLARFHDVDTGSISIGGVDIRDMSSDDLHATVGFVFQDMFLFGGTVADNIRLGRADASDDEVIAAAKAARAHSFISALSQGYQTQLGERGAGLSAGERQRISIARAILKAAPILVLDEATAFADPESEALVQDAIVSLAAGRTLVVITHRLRSVVNADLILVLDRGRIVERGRHRDLLAADGVYDRMWKAQEDAAAFRHGGMPAE